VKVDAADFVVALLGNPNTGKSTVFNALTGLRQHVGNWPGKTVSRAEGAFETDGKKYRIVDLPGCYSLCSSSHHEEIARDFILFGGPDVTVVVVDATRLERNLVIVLQTLEITGRVVVALNLMDEAKRRGLDVDARALSRRLGIPVVPMAARHGQGIDDLLAAIVSVATGAYETTPHRIHYGNGRLTARLEPIMRQLEQLFPGLPNTRWVALRLLDKDHSMIQAVREGTLGNIEAMTARVMPRLDTDALQEEQPALVPEGRS
jgi:ferrous iron transport protein B